MIIKRICCIGAGYIGGSFSSVLAKKCPEILVTVVDENTELIMQWNSEKLPVFEPGLDKVVQDCMNKNLFFSTDVITGIKNSDLIFLCVDVPPKTYGMGKGEVFDLKSLENMARLIADVAVGEKIVVERSTVPLKAADLITKILKANLHSNYQILSNPEFLSKGNALQDLLFPDRVIIGGEDTMEGKNAINKLSFIYEHWVPKEKIITTNTYTSELAKLATNAFLAQKISNINSLSLICESTGLDVTTLSEAIGLDSRIGTKYLRPSLGFGGNLVKDVMNLIYICKALGHQSAAEYWQQVITMNNNQITRFSKKIIESLFHSVTDKNIAILGFSFKKSIKDSQESPAIHVCKYLLNEGANLNIYDPQVPESQILKELDVDEENEPRKSVNVFNDPYDCMSYTHAIVVCTAWDEFKTLDYERIFSNMVKPAYIFDGQKILPHQDLLKIGYNVHCIGTCLNKSAPVNNWKPY